MSRRNLAWLLGIAAVSVLSLAFFRIPTHAENEDYEDVALVVDVLQKVRQSYVTDLDRKQRRKLVEDMVNGGLEKLDPHSQYINPQEFKQFKKTSQGKFGGIGIQVGYDRQNRGQLTVISPIVGTPAYDAGILAGDAIIKIDGKPTENMRMSEAVDMIQGEPGQPITLTILHEGEKEVKDIKIVRAEIKVHSVLGDLRKEGKPSEWNYFLNADHKIGYIRLTTFSEKSSQEMVAALKELKDAGMRGLIIDLRNDPGGLLRSAVEISNLFLREGDRIVSTKGRNSKDEVYDAQSEDGLLRMIYHGEPNEDALRAKAKGVTLQPAERYPIVVLVNRYSASASEILSAALQDHGRAVIVGERSYGKGSVQNIIPMEHDASALKLTTASYWRPSGKNIHRFPDSKETDDWGVRPNDSGYKLTSASLKAHHGGWVLDVGFPGDYKLTSASLKALRTDRVADEVLAKLKDFPDDKRFLTEKEYLDELGKFLSADELSQNKAKLIADADRGFEVPMNDEERLDYMIYRNERDVVRNKKPDDKKDQKKDDKKKPFKDRVLEKAVEYLNQEIDKGGAGADRLPLHDA
jgi:carboxyl-terminal processing protease